MKLLEDSLQAFPHRMFVSLVVAGKHECHHVGNQRMEYLTELLCLRKVAFPHHGYYFHWIKAFHWIKSHDPHIAIVLLPIGCWTRMLLFLSGFPVRFVSRGNKCFITIFTGNGIKMIQPIIKRDCYFICSGENRETPCIYAPSNWGECANSIVFERRINSRSQFDGKVTQGNYFLRFLTNLASSPPFSGR